MKKLLGSILFFAALSTGAANAAVTTHQFTGNFTTGNDVFTYAFTITEDTLATFETFGYAGGTLANGATVADGGFDPTLTLFGSTFETLVISDDGDAVEDRESASSEFSWDDLITLTLAPGNYTIALTQFDNNWNTGTNSWTNFAAESFIDAANNQRTSAYALQVTLEPSPVPVPAAIWLFGSGLFGLLWSAKRKQVI
ncbi:MAG: DVUA0089 family protein [Methylococcaceae bacterium]|nr:DVUA0089 family protein [Methylococcaceae bacterium]MDZ4157659.1 DVUA0089 family protein [Methylococcales bacterium]MDP2393089.1 DVUA0089 family protein [Methylococcaceae bacterium]MDP3019233.1 DVUA0089 family protein [Methylococcaceae bacterium]MDP3389186.1 DVUA0089 family protein [Methylococcaceae bacterium]